MVHMTQEEIEEESAEIQSTCENCGDYIEGQDTHYHITYQSGHDGRKNVGFICSVDCLAEFPTEPLDEDSYSRRSV